MLKLNLDSVKDNQIEKFKLLAIAAAKWYTPRGNRFLFDEIFSACMVAIAEAILTFDSNIGESLEKHVSARCFFAACDEYRTLTRHRLRKGGISRPEPFSTEPAHGKDQYKQFEITDELDVTLRSIPDNFKKLFELKLQGYTNTDIAKMLGCCQSNVSRLFDRACVLLEEKTKAPGIKKRLSETVFGSNGLRAK